MNYEQALEFKSKLLSGTFPVEGFDSKRLDEFFNELCEFMDYTDNNPDQVYRLEERPQIEIAQRFLDLQLCNQTETLNETDRMALELELYALSELDRYKDRLSHEQLMIAFVQLGIFIQRMQTDDNFNLFTESENYSMSNLTSKITNSMGNLLIAIREKNENTVN